MKINEKIKDVIAFLIIIFFSLIISFLTNSIPFLESLEESLINERFKQKSYLRPTQRIESGIYKEGDKVKSDIMILGIDETSVSSDFLGPFPWPRSVYADFLNYFRFQDGKYAPQYIFFDIFFDYYRQPLANNYFIQDFASFIYQASPWQQEKEQRGFVNRVMQLYGDFPTPDTVFFRELKKHNNVFFDYLSQYGEQERFSEEVLKTRLPYLMKAKLTVKNPDDFDGPFISDVKPPVKEVLEHALGVGSALVEADRDGSIRRMPLFFLFYDSRMTEEPVFLPTIDLSIIMKYFNVGAEDVEIVVGKHVKIRNAKIPQKEPDTEGGFRIKGFVKKDVTIPIDREGKMYINFQGESGSFENLSFAFINSDVERQNAALYKNRILLVGFYSTAGLGQTKDYFNTPYSSMYGIEIHANALYTILSQKFIQKIPRNIETLVMVLLIMLVALILFKLNIIKGLALGLGVLLLVFLSGIFLFAGSLFGIKIIDAPLYLMQMTEPLSAILTAIILTISYKVITEEKEKKWIKGIFGNYVNPEVVNEIIKDPSKLQLGGETRELTVLFSDIRGFTTLSESLTPQELVFYLNKYLSVMTNILLKNQGTLDKYIGDAIMAFWGAPIYYENHAYLACKTCLEMMDQVYILNSSGELPENIRINIGIGLNSGDMTVGNMGSELRKNYTVMGDHVNLASRLEGANKVYRTNIIISDNTYEKVKDLFLFRELDLIRVKGKKKPVKIYELLGFKEEVERLGYRLEDFNPKG